MNTQSCNFNYSFIAGFGNDATIFDLLIQEMNLKKSQITCLSLPKVPAEVINDYAHHQNITKALHSYLYQFEHSIPKKTDILLASSLAGMLAIKLLENNRCPELKQLIVISTNLTFRETKNWPFAMKKEIFHQFKQSFISDDKRALRRFYALELLQDECFDKKEIKLKAKEKLNQIKNLDIQSHLLFLDFLDKLDLTDSIKKIKTRIHFIFGENDALIPIETYFAIKKKITKHYPNISLSMIEGAGHLPMLSTAKKTCKVIQAVLRNHSVLSY